MAHIKDSYLGVNLVKVGGNYGLELKEVQFKAKLNGTQWTRLY
jgi:hypothetical protein